jgi:hypothetical protein
MILQLGLAGMQQGSNVILCTDGAVFFQKNKFFENSQ